MLRVLGIDPGLNGAAAIYEVVAADMGVGTVGSIIDIADLPTLGEGPQKVINAALMFKWVVGHKPTHSVIENVWSQPGEGVSSAFRFGRAVGALQAILQCSGLPYALVAPATWKRASDLLKQPKEASRLKAMAMFPSALPWLQRKKDHQRAEALLLASYYAGKLTS